MEAKLCCTCKITKNLTDFSKNKNNRDGYNGYCKSCRREYHRRHQLNYLANNPNARLSHKLRCRINHILNGNIRSSATAEIIGTDHETFLEWISYQFTPDMHFGNYGTVWNFDHLLPLSHFNLLDENELKKAMNWRNLQPIIVIKNSEKFNTVDLDLAIAQEIKAEYFLEMLELNKIDPPQIL
jgi:transposase-like protein